jgi:cytochrome c biogenesis protein CcdA
LLTTAATLGFGAFHSSVATRAIDGRHGSRQLTVRSELVGRHTSALVIGFLLVLVAATVGIALVINAFGAPQPALIASVVVAIAVLLGGPQLMRFVRRRAARTEPR